MGKYKTPEEKLLEAIFAESQEPKPEGWTPPGWKLHTVRGQLRKKKPRRIVREWLQPYIEDFLINKVKWNKMPPDLGRDPVDFLYAYFRNSDGKRLIKQILQETGREFTHDEIMNTFIDLIYKMNIDYSTIKLEAQPEENFKSYWDKISDEGHV